VNGHEYRKLYDEAAARLEGIARGLVVKGLEPVDAAGLFVAIGLGGLTDYLGEGGAAAWLEKAAKEARKLPYKPN
jgi:hypothetical protein